MIYSKFERFRSFSGAKKIQWKPKLFLVTKRKRKRKVKVFEPTTDLTIDMGASFLIFHTMLLFSSVYMQGCGTATPCSGVFGGSVNSGQYCPLDCSGTWYSCYCASHYACLNGGCIACSSSACDNQPVNAACGWMTPCSDSIYSQCNNLVGKAVWSASIQSFQQ